MVTKTYLPSNLCDSDSSDSYDRSDSCDSSDSSDSSDSNDSSGQKTFFFFCFSTKKIFYQKINFDCDKIVMKLKNTTKKFSLKFCLLHNCINCDKPF